MCVAPFPDVGFVKTASRASPRFISRILPSFLLFLNHDASHWRWGWDSGGTRKLLQRGRNGWRGEGTRGRASEHRVRCLRTSNIWHTCYISSTCCHCTHTVSQSVAVTEPHMHMPDAPSPTDMDSFRDRGNCIEHSKMRAKRARIT